MQLFCEHEDFWRLFKDEGFPLRKLREKTLWKRFCENKFVKNIFEKKICTISFVKTILWEKNFCEK
jgi:hypothetical protein